MTRTRIEKLHKLFKDNDRAIFEQQLDERHFADFAMSLRHKTIDQIANSSFSSTWKELVQSETYDNYMSFVDILFTRTQKQVSADNDISAIVDLKKYVWECKPEDIAQVLKQIGMGVEEAVVKIKNQYIEASNGSMRTVMARSHNTDVKEMNDSMEVFMIAKETDKRDAFIEQLRNAYK